MSRALKLYVRMGQEEMDYLGDLFVEQDVLNKKGISFLQFIELWKQGKLEEVLN